MNEESTRYIILKNKLSIIKTNTESLKIENDKLISLLNNNFKINNEIVEKDVFDEINNNLEEVQESINQVINNCNTKI